MSDVTSLPSSPRVTTLRARLALGLACATIAVPVLMGTLAWLGMPVRSLIVTALAFSSASGVVAVAQAAIDLALARRHPEQRRGPAIAALVLVLLAPLAALAASYAMSEVAVSSGLVHGEIAQE